MTTPAPTVYVVDDDDGVRSSIRFLLKSVGLNTTSFASAKELLAAYDPNQPGCLVLDVRMPEMSGMELQVELNRLGAVLPIVFITGHGDVPMAVEAMQHGAFDFLQKPFRDEDLLQRIKRAIELDATHRAELRQADAIKGRLDSLTPREREVLHLMSDGKQNKIMAAELGLSQRTVEIHRANVMDKMQARGACECWPARLLPARICSILPEPESGGCHVDAPRAPPASVAPGPGQSALSMDRTAPEKGCVGPRQVHRGVTKPCFQ
jgi:two-component system response regulator FixJ